MNGPYDRNINFGAGMGDFGRTVLRELVMTDYGEGLTYNGISGHTFQNHHGGFHEQVNLWKSGLDDSGVTIRFFDK